MDQGLRLSLEDLIHHLRHLESTDALESLRSIDINMMYYQTKDDLDTYKDS